LSTLYVRFDARPGAADGRLRAPRLEQLLARADAQTRVDDWRADALQRPDLPAVAPAARGAAAGSDSAGEGWVYLATPVEYVAEMARVRMSGSLPSLSQPQAAALAGAFNALWTEGRVRMEAGRGAVLYCIFAEALPAATRDPSEVRGEAIETFLPGGGGAKTLRLLMSEIEMWLFDSALNRERVGAGLTPLASLWLWGGGPARLSARQTAALETDAWHAGGDVLLSNLCAPAPVSWDHRRPGIVVVDGAPGSAAWEAFETRWMQPALRALRAGTLTRLEICGGQRRFSVSAGWRRRFWRRARAWWEYFE
jgi:hypothetical protein